MDEQNSGNCTAFAGECRIASGKLPEVARKVKDVLDRGEQASVLVFDDFTGELVEVDFRGTAADVLKRLAKPTAGGQSGSEPSDSDQSPPRGPGRPRLGVVSREVTLLPRHWDWLNSQPGGASVALRKLVEEARRDLSGRDKARRSKEAAYRFMSAMAGNLPGFEETARALFAGSTERFEKHMFLWPADIRDYARMLAQGAFQSQAPASAYGPLPRLPWAIP